MKQQELKRKQIWMSPAGGSYESSS